MALMALMASIVFGMNLPLNTGQPVVELKTNIFGNDFFPPLPNSTWHHTTTMAKTKELFNETAVLKALNDVEKALLYAEEITLKRKALEKILDEAFDVYINAILADKKVKEEIEALKTTYRTTQSEYWNIEQEEKKAWSDVLVAKETYNNVNNTINVFLQEKHNQYLLFNSDF
jgi:hypothetical protein